jgi:hypothetical protein
MGMRSPQSNRLRWLTLYLLIGLAILLFAVNLFPPFSSQAVSEKPTPTLPAKFLTSTAKAQVKATTTAIAAQTALAQGELTAIATNPVSLGTPPVVIHLTNIDEQKLIANDQRTMKTLSDQIQKGSSQKVQGNPVALVVIYVGVDSANSSFLPNAPQVASQIESILTDPASKLASSLKKAQYQKVVYVGNLQLPDSSNQTLTGSKDLSTADLAFYLYSTSTGQ